MIKKKVYKEPCTKCSSHSMQSESILYRSGYVNQKIKLDCYRLLYFVPCTICLVLLVLEILKSVIRSHNVLLYWYQVYIIWRLLKKEKWAILLFIQFYCTRLIIYVCMSPMLIIARICLFFRFFMWSLYSITITIYNVYKCPK